MFGLLCVCVCLGFSVCVCVCVCVFGLQCVCVCLGFSVCVCVVFFFTAWGEINYLRMRQKMINTEGTSNLEGPSYVQKKGKITTTKKLYEWKY